MNQKHFVAISGSLRKGSYNTMTLRALQKLAPGHITIEEVLLHEVPMYNFDLHDAKFPDKVQEISDKVKNADAIILVTPEYNYSMPGVLKNFIDFLSRAKDKPFNLKPTGILGASPGLMGSSRAQYQLRQVMQAVNAQVMSRPEVMISKANSLFNEAGEVHDETTMDHLKKFIISLDEYSEHFPK